jgi:hypothetical protein
MKTTTVLKNIAITLAGTTLISLGVSEASHAGSITTTFAHNNFLNGNMFDLTTFGNSLLITGLDINVAFLDAGDTLQVYLKTGTYVGSETNSSAWSLVSSTPVNSANATDTPTFVDVTDFSLQANTTYGLYVTLPSGFLAYTNGANTFSNADLQLDLGVGKEYPFASTFSPRTWNGTVYYDVQQTVPENDTVFGLLTIGALGAGLVLKRKLK